MPLQNRVRPDGEIIAAAGRGTFMGNRGILHDDRKRIVRQSRSAMWLICQLEFNGRKQELMRPDRYTQLFFLDEAVALAAGHRPCGECRRKHYSAYIEAANVGNDNPISGAADLDRQLRASRSARRTTSAIAALPDGAFISLGDNDFRLVWRGNLYKWSAAEYTDPIAVADLGAKEAVVVTPSLSVSSLRHGYPVNVHASVGSAVGLPSAGEDVPRRIGANAKKQVATAIAEKEPSVTGLTAELRSEIEQILRHSSPGLTHGELFRYMEQGLSEEEMLERHGTSPSNIRNFMRSLDHLLNGTLPETKSAARVNSMVYKELLNHGLSPELLSYVKSRLRRLMDINADITMAPLRTRSHRYPTKSPRKAPPESLCPLCHLAKPCDCD